MIRPCPSPRWPKVGRASCLPRPDQGICLEQRSDPTSVFSLRLKTSMGRLEALPDLAVAAPLRRNDWVVWADEGGPSRAATRRPAAARLAPPPRWSVRLKRAESPRRLRGGETGRAKAPAEPPCDFLPTTGSSGHTRVVRQPQASHGKPVGRSQAERRRGGSLRPTSGWQIGSSDEPAPRWMTWASRLPSLS